MVKLNIISREYFIQINEVEIKSIVVATKRDLTFSKNMFYFFIFIAEGVLGSLTSTVVFGYKLNIVNTVEMPFFEIFLT